ncbi:MAG: hypothetical protein ACXWWC_00140 [Chitinophagaceae bacterium]
MDVYSGFSFLINPIQIFVLMNAQKPAGDKHLPVIASQFIFCSCFKLKWKEKIQTLKIGKPNLLKPNIDRGLINSKESVLLSIASINFNWPFECKEIFLK